MRSFPIVLILLLLAGNVSGQSEREVRDFERALIAGTLTELTEFSSEQAPLDDFRIFDQSVLLYAARNFDRDRLAVIIDGHDSLDIVDDTGTTAVMHALMAGRVENALLLFQHGASLEGVNDQGYSVRVLAEELGMEFGPEYATAFPALPVPSEDANEILLLAAEAGDMALIEWALTLGADLAAQARNGLQAAHLAALGGHAEVFDSLLSHAMAPSAWSVLPGTSGDLSVIDFVIAGEGGGDRSRAVTMLRRAAASASLSPIIEAGLPQFRGAMARVGYDGAQIAEALGVAPPTPLVIDIPASGRAGGPTAEDWRALQRFLHERGLYDAEIDGVVGRGTLRGVILHVLVEHVPALIDGTEAARLLAGDTTQGAEGTFGWVQLWRLDGMTERWASGTLSSGPRRDQAVQGFTTILPPGASPSSARLGPGTILLYSDAPQITQPPRTGQLALTLLPEGAELGAHFSLSVPVHGTTLSAQIFDSRIVYQWGLTGRRYEIEETILLPDRLQRLLEANQ